MIWMDVDAALAEVPVNIVPLIDDTDFKTREESVVYNQAGLDLVWNFVTSAGAYTQTAVTPTTGGGDYDWTNQGNGMYSIKIPASGGASINNDTEGYGWFTGYATGILPWSGPVIGFRAAGLNDKLCDSAYSTTRGLAGTALPDAVADAAGGLPISDTGGLDMDAILADTNEIQGKLPTNKMMGSSDGADDDGTLNTIAGYLDTEIAAILEDTNELQGLISSSKLPAQVKGIDDIDLSATMKSSVNAEVDTALSDINLDHLCKTATGGADMTTEVADNTILSRMLANGDTSAFTPSTDGLQPIRDRGDAAWAGAPEVASGTFTVQTPDTVFNLTASSGTLSGDDDAYNNMIICMYDNSGGIYETRRITDYDGTNTRVTLDEELTFPGEDGVDTWVIYRAAYCPVGAASITEGDKNDIADKVWDEADADHIAQGTKGQRLHHAVKGRY